MRSPGEAAAAAPLPQSRRRLSRLPSPRRGIDRAPSPRPRTLSKTQPTWWRRTATYNPSLTAGVGGGKKIKREKKRFAQNLFFYAACVQISTWFKEERYISIELRKKKSLCPWLCLMAFRCQFLCWCFLYSDVRYVYLCTEAADRDVNKLYICKFELWELVGKYFAIEPINNSMQTHVTHTNSHILDVQRRYMTWWKKCVSSGSLLPLSKKKKKNAFFSSVMFIYLIFRAGI